MLTFFKRPTWPLRPNRVYVFERTTTPNKWLKNIDIDALKILTLDSQKLLPSKNIQHELVQKEEISEVREAT